MRTIINKKVLKNRKIEKDHHIGFLRITKKQHDRNKESHIDFIVDCLTNDIIILGLTK